jgi:hypothetical protein
LSPWFGAASLPTRHHLQCLSWHCALQAVGFFIAKFLAHQLVQNAAHFGDAAAALVRVTGASLATINATIAARARMPLIFASIFPFYRSTASRLQNRPALLALNEDFAVHCNPVGV